MDIFPEMFENIPNDSPMHIFGFECLDGWFGLLEKLITDIKKVSEEKHFIPHVCQVKEKYGSLRFYLESYIDEISDLINEACKASESICEVCGKSGKIHKVTSWLFTRCQECLKP